jgi:hypothetical protein
LLQAAALPQKPTERSPQALFQSKRGRDRFVSNLSGRQLRGGGELKTMSWFQDLFGFREAARYVQHSGPRCR